MPARAVNQQAASAETPILYLAQKDQYDVDFLLQLAHSQGYGLEADETLQQIYFGPTQSSVASNYQLEWGKGLISFKPSLSTTTTVRPRTNATSSPTVPITVAPRCFAHWQTIRPTPPAAAWIRIVSPRFTGCVRRTRYQAVMPFSIIAAAC